MQVMSVIIMSDNVETSNVIKYDVSIQCVQCACWPWPGSARGRGVNVK